MDNFSEISKETIDDFYNIFNKKAFVVSTKFEFVGNSKQKQLVKISKIPDQFSFLLDKELLVTINEDLMNVYDEESITILFEQEIDKIEINLDSGKIKLLKTDLNTFSSLVNKYGVEKVTKANGIEVLYQQQKIDANSEEFII